MNIITRDLSGQIVGQDQDNGYIHLNPIANASGKRVADWKENKETTALLAQFNQDPTYQGFQPLVAIGGRNGGTWAHPDIAIQFAQWCNPAFTLQVSRWVREWMTTGKNPIAPMGQLLFYERLKLFLAHTTIPDTHWCVFQEISGLLGKLEVKGFIFPDQAVPDISVGLCWSKWLERQGKQVEKVYYPHHYPDSRGVQPARIYPNELAGDFKTWLGQTYIPNKLPGYVKEICTIEESRLVMAALGHPIFEQKQLELLRSA